ncbi:PHP domain-containing protein [Nesterenkonia alba]|uniref:PHP domain-containing protein n=1 Tax=Nesterenkonia alba TaxID=515814 RepID=UPI0003B63676|nr:PHP domain-containing protein [Nesterenkonia alba]
MSYDLHTHSEVSDGTEPPAQVVAAAARAGLRGLALTDHDTTVGWEQARAAAREHGLLFIPGAEITTKTSAGTSVHMLSYLHDPQHPGLAAANSAARSGRVQRAKRIVANLAEDFEISWADVLTHVGPETTVGRPHIADALVTTGVVADRSEAFTHYLHKGSKYYVPQDTMTPVEAITLIRQAGGVPVIAHAMASRRGSTVSLAELEEMVQAGLAGVEVYHRDNTAEGKELLLDLARRRDLIVTGSSDYHGTGKPNRLGENTTDAEMVLRILQQGTGTEALGGPPAV